MGLYYVVQMKAGLEDEEYHDINVEGTFTSYLSARDYALKMLLDSGNRIIEESFSVYDTAGPSQADCEYGDNIIVNAVGKTSQNF
jgi:hypothetical protein